MSILVFLAGIWLSTDSAMRLAQQINTRQVSPLTLAAAIACIPTTLNALAELLNRLAE